MQSNGSLESSWIACSPVWATVMAMARSSKSTTSALAWAWSSSTISSFLRVRETASSMAPKTASNCSFVTGLVTKPIAPMASAFCLSFRQVMK